MEHIFYTKNNCSQCESAKSALESLELTSLIKFINVEEQPEFISLMVSNGIRSMPAFSIDGKFVSQFEFTKSLKELV